MSITKFCADWSKTIATGGGTARKRWQSVNVFYDGRTIYSYGEHFPMGYILAPDLVWLNGDRFSVSTGRHQSELRGAIATYAPNATVVIVPRTALEAAGLDYRTIQPVDVKTERWEYTAQTSATAPADMRPAEGWSRFGDEHVPTTEGGIAGHVTRDGSAQAVRRNADGTYTWHTARHWLGDCVFTASGQPGGTWDRFARAYVTRERGYYVSSFDRQERQPLYFLSQLPGPVDTLEDAIESLAPESVKTARMLGRDVVRQGDMFAIPMDVDTRALKALGATFERRTVNVTLRPGAAANVAQRELLRSLVDVPERGKRHDWTAQHAFRTWVNENADDLLARFEAHCKNMTDRGQVPFTDYLHADRVTRYSLESALTYTPSDWERVRTVTGTALYGTAHTATEVATLPDGRQFARGTMYHEPAVAGEPHREADHRRQPLGKRWHLVARNTVPVSGTGRGRRAA